MHTLAREDDHKEGQGEQGAGLGGSEKEGQGAALKGADADRGKEEERQAEDFTRERGRVRGAEALGHPAAFRLYLAAGQHIEERGRCTGLPTASP